jgi:hypothetical protein
MSFIGPSSDLPAIYGRDVGEESKNKKICKAVGKVFVLIANSLIHAALRPVRAAV